MVQTDHHSCTDYCASQGLVCRHAQDNNGSTQDALEGSGCGLNHDHHETQDMGNNGCEQQWNGQVCRGNASACLPL